MINPIVKTIELGDGENHHARNGNFGKTGRWGCYATHG